MIALLALAGAGPLSLEHNLDLLTGQVDVSPWGLELAAGHDDVVALAGPVLPAGPRELELAVDEVADGLAWAWAVIGNAPPGARAGLLKVTWADGSQQARPLILGEDVARFGAPETLPYGVMVPVGGDALTVWTWRNPRPDVPIQRIVLQAADPRLSLAVAAVSTWSGEPPVDHVPVASRPDGLARAVDPAQPLPGPEAWRVEGPAGDEGFVVVRDGHFAFEQGGRVRFWGVNLLNEVAVPTMEESDVLARQVADAGFNMARLHHVDSQRVGVVEPGNRFDDEKLDRMDYLAARLADEGVYLFLEVATNRSLGSPDGASGPYAGVPNGHKLVSMFDPTWTAAYEAWLRAWLDRENPHRGLRLAEDPSIAVVELGNEHTLVGAWLSGGLERLPAAHRATLDDAWNAWLAERYANDVELAAAWTGSVHEGLQAGEQLGAVQRAPVASMHVDSWPEARTRDLYLFYAELEATFYARMKAVVREIGFRVPITTTAAGRHESSALHAHRDDFADTHFYWDQIARKSQLSDASMVASPSSGRLGQVLAEAHHGKPFSISELNTPHGNHAATEAPLAWATLAGVQDWDALVWLNYTNGPYDPAPAGIRAMWELSADPLRWGQMPVASALFRSGQLTPAPGLRLLHSAPDRVVARVAARREPSRPELDDVSFWLGHQVRSSFTSEVPAVDVAGEPIGDVGWWPDAGLLVADTTSFSLAVGPCAQGGSGEGGGLLASERLRPCLDDFAAVSLVDLDGTTLGEGDALLTVAGRTYNAGQVQSVSGRTILEWGGGGTTVVQPRGEVVLSWPRRPEVRPLAVDGSEGAPVRVRRVRGGDWRFELSDETMSWVVR